MMASISMILRLFVFIAILPVMVFSEVVDSANQNEEIDFVTIAILAKDKEGTLPLFFKCLENQTWPRQKTYLYIRTNNNTDRTVDVINEWLEKEGDTYAGIYFDDSDVPERVQDYQNHEWNGVRFKVLAKIRQDSVEWAKAVQSHYFVVDCDNFIVPDTIEKLVSLNLPVVAPLLRAGGRSLYANYHAAVDRNGYYAESPNYYSVLNRTIKGIIEMPVVHCTYLIRYEYLDDVLYEDHSGRYEYVIFSDHLRQLNIPQYLDNRQLYGRITFENTLEGLNKEQWINEF